jgi:hypothetical protein
MSGLKGEEILHAEQLGDVRNDLASTANSSSASTAAHVAGSDSGLAAASNGVVAPLSPASPNMQGYWNKHLQLFAKLKQVIYHGF